MEYARIVQSDMIASALISNPIHVLAARLRKPRPFEDIREDFFEVLNFWGRSLLWTLSS